MRPLLLAAGLVAASGAQTGDDQLFGHLPYPEAPREALAQAPASLTAGMPCRVRATVLPDLLAMLAAAEADGARLRLLSCFRSVAYQQAVFSRHKRGADAATRALEVGPPGHSEHATGYAIDFAVRPWTGCRDVDPCFANTMAGRWLLANGPRFGFELSFPAGNAQGVTNEPWHWRWAGITQDELGAAEARMTFARARIEYPANPAAIGFALRTTAPSNAATPMPDRDGGAEPSIQP